MKKIIFIPFIFLLLFPLVSAHDFNFTANYTLGAQYWIEERINAYYYGGSWFVASFEKPDLGTTPTLTIQKFNPFTFSLVYTDAINFSSLSNRTQYADCQVRVLADGKPYYECLGKLYVPADRVASIVKYSLIDRSQTILSEADIELADFFFPAVANKINLKTWKKADASNDITYTTIDDLNDLDGEGDIDLLAGFHNPRDLQIVSCGGALHVIIKHTDLILDLIYDQTTYDYQIAYGFKPSYWIIDEDDYGVWTRNDILYITMVNDTGAEDEGGLINFQAWSCDPDYRLTQIYEQTYNQTEIEPTANHTNGKMMKHPFLIKDGNGIFNLFYAWVTSAADETLKVATDSGLECTCGDWMAKPECEEEYQKYNRTCAPYGCESNLTNWVETEYCGQAYNETLGIYEQEYTKWTKQTSCESDWVVLGSGVAECSPDPIQIPFNCININVTETAIPHFSAGAIECDQGNYDMVVCNPAYDCSNYTYPCSERNHSATKESEEGDYIAGEYATGVSSLTVEPLCQCGWKLLGITIWQGGITRFKIWETLTVQCDIACEEEWVCMNENYRALRHEDCSYSNQTYCEFGCSDGVCQGAGEGDISPSSPDYWINFFLNPTTVGNRFIIGIMGSVAIGSVGIYFGNQSQHSFLYFLLMFSVGWAFFTVTGFIPAIITIIIVFAMGGYFLLTRLKG